MYGTVFMVTLIVTFANIPLTYYSHHPLAIYMSKEICNDVLDNMYEYYHEGSLEYIREKHSAAKDLETLELECQEYYITKEGFIPKEYKYEEMEEINYSLIGAIE